MFYMFIFHRNLYQNIRDISLPSNSSRFFSIFSRVSHPPFSPFRVYTVLFAFAAYSLHLRLILRTKRHLRRFLSVPECIPLTRSRSSSHLDFPRFISTTILGWWRQTTTNALMHRKCPPAGKSPGAENSRAPRSAFSSCRPSTRCCSDW